MKNRADSGCYDAEILKVAAETDFKFDAKINKVLLNSAYVKDW